MLNKLKLGYVSHAILIITILIVIIILCKDQEDLSNKRKQLIKICLDSGLRYERHYEFIYCVKPTDDVLLIKPESLL